MSYFIKVDNVFYYLDSTTSIEVTYPARLSTHPLHSKRSASDHYFTDQPTMTIEGVISDIKSAKSNDRTKGTQEYIDGLLRAMDRRIPLSVKHRLDKEEEPNWFITNFNPSQDTTYGFGGVKQGPDGNGKIIQSFRVSIQLSRALIAEGATTSVESPQAFKDVLQEQGRRSSSTQVFDPSASGQKKEGDIFAKANEYGRNSKTFLQGATTGVLPTTEGTP